MLISQLASNFLLKKKSTDAKHKMQNNIMGILMFFLFNIAAFDVSFYEVRNNQRRQKTRDKVSRGSNKIS
jgi:hypothetical protein